MFFRFFDTCLPWFAFWLKNGIFISHDGKSNEALTFLAETQILAGLEVMLILLDICKHFYQLVGYLLDICWMFVDFVGYLQTLLSACWIFVGYLSDICWIFVDFVGYLQTLLSASALWRIHSVHLISPWEWETKCKIFPEETWKRVKNHFASAFTNPSSQKLPLHGWCLLVLYWSVLFCDKI